MRVLLAIALSCLFNLPALAQEWTRFRGPNGSGLSQANIPAQWSESSIKWQADLPGQGHGSPTLWGNKLFLITASPITESTPDKGKPKILDDGDGTRFVNCIDARSGKTLWSKPFDSDTHKKHRFNSYASSTPAVDDQRVYAAWATPDQISLVALTHDGRLVWRRDLGKLVGGHGFATSPIVVDDLVILGNDQEKGPSSLLAFDKITGETRWSVPRNSQKLTFATPCVFTAPNGQKEIVFSNWTHGLTSINPKTGAINWELDLWDKPGAGKTERAISSPIAVGDLIITTCGFVNRPKRVAAVRPASASKTGKTELLWKDESNVPHIPCVLVADELLYLWSDDGIVSCVDPYTGKRHWRSRITDTPTKFFGSPVYSNGKIFNVSEYGDVYVLRAGTKYERLAINKLDQLTRATPAIANNNMYVRTYEKLICIQGR
ncbi:MAG: PQQ-like beta-propeller repeat protein [Planctomycetota bacterium]|jgi:outer membrane protein assembly factor BamB